MQVETFTKLMFLCLLSFVFARITTHVVEYLFPPPPIEKMILDRIMETPVFTWFTTAARNEEIKRRNAKINKEINETIQGFGIPLIVVFVAAYFGYCVL